MKEHEKKIVDRLNKYANAVKAGTKPPHREKDAVKKPAGKSASVRKPQT